MQAKAQPRSGRSLMGAGQPSRDRLTTDLRCATYRQSRRPDMCSSALFHCATLSAMIFVDFVARDLRQLFIRGATPEQAVDQVQAQYWNTRSFERLRPKR
jgi:hypothetical protein